MAYRRVKHPPQRQLPLTHHRFVSVKTDGLVTLVFEDTTTVQASITLEQRITITISSGMVMQLAATKPGPSFDPQQLEPLLALRGSFVKQATAYRDGRLTVLFDNGAQLLVVPEVYEAWHFQRPAPFSPNKDTQEHLSLTGTDGELL